MSDDKNENNGIDWRRLVLRKDRPLPKQGCSWVFYAVLLILIVYLLVMFLKYRNS